MRILVDCTLAYEICPILNLLDYEATCAADLGIEARFDEAALGRVKDYDCLLTISTFGDPSEWLLMHRASIEHALAIVQIRLPKIIDNPALDALRCILAKIDDWILVVLQGYPLIIISKNGTEIRFKTKEEVADMIQQRSDADKAQR